ncbi:unknown [Singapore grouper iridovirus]|uniref:Uncharacterized protein n=1 Tax=Singapore grouper iridovirus TaxID=262968 RepID=Q5YFH3_9VIRU|nr:hypothetical protein ORF092L [Singapore grouper iridovirus]AAS18107.1 unknown [Singapore grouper iridovirus]WAU86801.1 hypothetical protein ORF092L [Singapore grouper iridovirus]
MEPAAQEWVIDQMLKHAATGGVVRQLWQTDLIQSVIYSDIFPKSKAKTIIISRFYRRRFWTKRDFPYVFSKIIDIPIVLPEYEMVWIETFEYNVVEDSKLAKRLSRNGAVPVWFFVENMPGRERERFPVTLDTYTPFVEITDRAAEIVEFETEPHERHIYAVYSQLLNLQTHRPNERTLKAWAPREAFFWPEIAVAKTLMHGNEFVKNLMTGAETAEEEETEIQRFARAAVNEWCPNRGSATLDGLCFSHKRSSMLKKLDERLRSETEECLIIVQTTAQAKYLKEHLDRCANIKTYKQICYAESLPPVVFAPLRNFNDATRCGIGAIKALSRKCCRLILFEPVDFVFTEMMENKVFIGNEEDRYRLWLDYRAKTKN